MYKCHEAHFHGKECAFKKFNSSFILNFPHACKREADILRKVQGHCNIVTMEAAVIEEIGGNCIGIVTEMCQMDLLDMLQQSYPLHIGVAWKQITRELVADMFAAVLHLHAHDVCHGDIKCENCLLQCNEHHSYTLKLADMGLALHATDGMRRDISGTGAYQAPEVYYNKKSWYNGRHADAWSCGIVLFALVVNFLPGARLYSSELFQYVESVVEPCLHADQYDFLKGVLPALALLLHTDPEKRSIAEANLVCLE